MMCVITLIIEKVFYLVHSTRKSKHHNDYALRHSSICVHYFRKNGNIISVPICGIPQVFVFILLRMSGKKFLC